MLLLFSRDMSFRTRTIRQGYGFTVFEMLHWSSQDLSYLCIVDDRQCTLKAVKMTKHMTKDYVSIPFLLTWLGKKNIPGKVKNMFGEQTDDAIFR